MNTALAGLPEPAEFDVIVIGAGGAGMAAALFASIKGLSVLLVERTEYVGGTTALSAGTVWVPGTLHADPADSRARAAAFLDAAIGNHAPAALRQAFLQHGPAAIATLEANSELRLRAYKTHPDYLQEIDGAALRGRALEPLPFDGRRLGAAFALLRPPIPEFTLFGGMMVDRTDISFLLNATKSLAALRHTGALLVRYGLDRLRHGRGTRLVMGNALVGRLLASLLARNVRIVTGAELTALTRERSASFADGATTRVVTARRGIVLAAGGFIHHPTRRAAWLPAPTPVHDPTAPGATGTAQDLALQLGAVFAPEGADAAFWAPVSSRIRGDGSAAAFPHFVLDRSKPGTVCVDARGHRFTNESAGYHDFARAMFAAGANPAFMIADAVALRRYGLGMVRPGGRGLRRFLADGYLTEAPTLAGLATRLGIDPATLAATIARMNAHAIGGEDPEFHRGSTDYHRHNGDPTHHPNPCLGPIATPPFYAIRLHPAPIGASRGLAVDARARLLDAAGTPIPGFCAVGNDMQSIMGGVYPAPGINIGPALVFAAIAAETLAA